MADDNEKWLQEINKWRDATSHIPALVREDIVKGRYRPDEASRGFKAVFEDPLAVQYSLGYKDRKHSLAYDVIKSIASNLSIVAAILQTRCNQVGSFAAPYRLTKSVGFVVKHKDPAKLTTKGEREMIKDLEAFIYNCGAAKPNPHNTHVKRDDFESFLKKIVRDTLLYDQVSVEVVPDRAGKPYEFIAVDASTIRFAAPNKLLGPDNTWHDRPPILPDHLLHAGPYKTMQLYGSQSPQRPAYLQVVRGQIENVYTADELFCGVRNPRTDIYVEGYGFGELEQLITIITAMLNAEAYNRNFFTNGSMPMGILNIKGDSMTDDQLEGFKRQWKSNLQGTNNSWATPIIQAESGVDWINLKPNNRDMEYSQWMEFLIKVACFTADTPVVMDDLSYKVIGDITPGDFVRTQAGNVKKVKNVQITHGSHKLVNLRAGDLIRCTPEHPFYVASSSFFNGYRNIQEPTWVAAKDIVPGRDYLCVTKASYKHEVKAHSIDLTDYLGDRPVKFSSDGTLIAPSGSSRGKFIRRVIPLTEENAFALGLYMAEGNTTKSCSFFCFHKDETNLVDNVQSFADFMGCRSQQTKAKESTANIKVHSTLLAEFLSNAFGDKALNKKVPVEIMTAEDNIKQAFFSGVFAGDGSVPDFANNSSTATISLASHSGVEQLRTLLLSQDVYAHPYTVVSSGFTRKTDEGVTQSVQRRLDVAGRQAAKLAVWLSGTKGDKLRSRLDGNDLPNGTVYETQANFFVPVSEVWEEEFEGPVYNLEVEDEHTYQVNRFAVHNCAVFLLDPAEINFDLHGGVSQTPLFESSQEWKLKASRDRGLKPLLRFIAKMINDNIIAKIDDHFVFDFVGLDELTEQEKHAMLQEQASSYLTLNEIRRELDKPDVQGGDMIMNPTYIQALQAKQQIEQTAQAAQGQQQAQQPQQQQAEGGQEEAQDDGAPEYVGTFTKSVGTGDILEITVDEDDYQQWFRLST